MKFTLVIKNGQLTGLAVFFCAVFGLSLAFCSIAYIQNYYLRMIGYSVGFAIAALGGYSGTAYAIHLRPFGKSPWRIAKETYKNSDEDAPESKKSLSEDQRNERKQSPKRDPRNDD